jgi:hypothetical protein
LKTKDICLFTNNVSPGIANLIQILNSADVCLSIFADSKTKQPLADHDICFPLVQELKKENIHSHGTSINKEWSVFFFTWAHWVPYSRQQINKLKDQVNKAEKVVLLYDASFGTSITRLIQQIRDIRGHKQIFQKVNEVCYMTDFPKVDFFSKFKRKFAFQTTAAVNINYCENLSNDLYKNYDPKIKRTYWGMVSGNHGTTYRQKVLRTLERYFEESSICLKVDKISKKTTKSQKTFYWSVGNSMISTNSYFNLLRNSNFTICLPGTYWTPRPFEAMACGSIPVMENDYKHSYDIPFKDGVNCISLGKTLKGDIWTRALNRILEFSEEKIIDIRKNIHELRQTHLLPEIHYKRQIRRYLG